MAKYCFKCGKELEDNSVFCTNCGTKQDGSTPVVTASVTVNSTNNSDPNAKSKVAAALLAFFLGGIGIHNFYLGYTGKGIAQLLISLLSCGFLAPISGIWAFVEFIMILIGSISTDANGVPLTD